MKCAIRVARFVQPPTRAPHAHGAWTRYRNCSAEDVGRNGTRPPLRKRLRGIRQRAWRRGLLQTVLSLVIVIAIFAILIHLVVLDVLHAKAVYYGGTVLVVIFAVLHEGRSWERQLNRKGVRRARRRLPVARPLLRPLRRAATRHAPLLVKRKRRTSGRGSLFGAAALGIAVVLIVWSLLLGLNYNNW